MSQCTVNVMLCCFVFLIKAVKKNKKFLKLFKFPSPPLLINMHPRRLCVCVTSYTEFHRLGE